MTLEKKMTKNKYYKMKTKDQIDWRIKNGIEAYADLMGVKPGTEERAKFVVSYSACCDAKTYA